MLLAIDIGNTNIHIGAFVGELPKAVFSFGAATNRTADEYAVLLKAIAAEKGIDFKEISGAVLGSVAPSLTASVLAALRILADVPVTIIGPGVKTGFPIRLDNPAELGADLVANAAGAVAAFGAPVIVADFGTATTVIAVDEKSALQGGAIMPGIGMSLQALNSAELLPGVPVDGTVLSLGKNTPDCMRAGVIRGTAMAVCGFAADYKKMLKLPQDTPLVVCGGLAGAARAYLPADAKYLPNLTLCGLAAIYRLNQKN